MPDSGSVSTFEAWVLAPSGSDYSWRTSGWVKETRLIPTRFNRRTGNTGSASFRILKVRRQEVGFATYRSTGQDLFVGSWIVITRGNTAASLNWSLVEWWGTLQSTQEEPDQSLGYIGTAQAAEVGPLLDTISMTGWMAGIAGAVPRSIEAPTTFNLNGEDGEVIGNRTTDNLGTEMLCSIPGDCGKAAANLWTRKRLLDYWRSWLLPDTFPVPALSFPADVTTYLSDTATPEVYDLNPLSVKGALDLFLPRPHGLGWRLNLAAGGSWRLDAWALLDAAEDGIPKQTATDVDLTGDGTVKSISYDINESTWYDEVVVLGAPILFCGSLAASDAAWINKWTTGVGSQEATWKTGSTESLVGSKLKDACAKIREGANVRDVFVRFGIGGYAYAGTLHRSAAPGGTAESAALAWFPTFTWDGTTVTPDNTAGADPLWTAARVERQLPWPIGVPGSITPGSSSDPRDAAAKAQPAYLEPRVFIYDSALTPTWRDLLVDEKHGRETRGGASVECDDRGPDLRIRCSPPEWLAGGDWASIVKPRIGIQGSNAPYGAYDYRKMVVTVAMRSDQRLRVVKRRAGVAANQVRRRLVLEDDKLQFWWAHEGTVVGIKADGTPDRITAAAWLRNDWPTAEKRARANAAWALTTRYTATIVLARPDYLPAWAVVGTLLGTITNGDTADTVGSVIEDISFDLSDTPSATITTDVPDGLTFGRGGGGSPAGGGPISLQLGATVPQAVATVQQELGQVRRDLARSPVVLPRLAQSGVDATLLEIRQASHGFAVGDVLRHNGTAWVKSQADTTANSVAAGVVAAVLSTDVFVFSTGGYVEGLSGLTAGAVHYLSAATAGALTTTAPAIPVAVILALSTTSGVLLAAANAGEPYALPGTTWVALSGSPYTLGSGPRYRRFMVVGAGGGGGGQAASQTQFGYISSAAAWTSAYLGVLSKGGSGGAGGTVIVDVDCAGLSTVTYTVGAAGTAGGTGSAGGNGGNSTLTVGGALITASGGEGGGAGQATAGGIGGRGSGGSISAGTSPAAIVASLQGQPGPNGGVQFRDSTGGIIWETGDDRPAASAAGLASGTPGNGGRRGYAGSAGGVYISA